MLTKPLTVCLCQPVAAMISSSVTQFARFIITITSAFLLLFGRRIPLATLLLYGVMAPRAVRTGLRLDVRFALRVLREYFLALHVKRSGAKLEAYPEGVQVLVKDVPDEMD
jgi:hypothetical protein